MLSKPDLVIFDCDGVLVNTEPVTLRVMAETAAGFGMDVPEHEWARTFKGRHISIIQADVEHHHGKPIPDFIERYRARMFAEFEHGIEPIPGAVAVLDALDDAGVAYCVASNGPHTKMDASLASAGLSDRLGGPSTGSTGNHDRIFSADDVANPKPAPDLFLHAAGRFRVEPARCLVVEDSPSGIVAARAAGMVAVGFSDLSPVEELQAEHAHAVITSMTDLIGLIGLPSRAR